MIDMNYSTCVATLCDHPKKWLITGVAGFIGSNLLQRLLELNQFVIGIDNLSTGYKSNLEEVANCVEPCQWNRFKFLESDIRDLDSCKVAMDGIDFVLHHAALGSVPRSLKDPISTHQVNIDGFLNVLIAARDANVKKFIFASSSSVYGDSRKLPKLEAIIGCPLSPYSVTKRVNEIYAEVFKKSYGLNFIGFRYFNVFGPRQDPAGEYAAVIPKWIDALYKQEQIFINGDGTTSRDFCFIENVVQANILAAAVENQQASNKIYNIAGGSRTTLNNLYSMLKTEYEKITNTPYKLKAIYSDFRFGDIKHSLASIDLAHNFLHYKVAVKIENGIEPTIKYFVKK